MDLLWIDGLGLRLCGPDSHAWSFELPPGTAVAGIRFRPGAAPAIFRLDALDVRDERVDAAELMSDREGRRLTEQLTAADSPASRTSVLEDLVRCRSGAAPADEGRIVELASLVASDPAYGVEHLAAETGVSSRQLRRRFDRAVGFGPAFLARVARMQRFARAAARHPDHGLAELAAAAGYTDQAHLAKDCRSIAGVTPRELVELLPRTSLAVRLGPAVVGPTADRGVRRSAA